ncbi:MAG: hypothetical protein ACTSVZ_06670 [Promethearchaeota archaeon]
MVLEKIIINALIYTGIGAGYLLIFMITFNPRIWGYQDYPDKIKVKIPTQTRKEKIIAGLIGLPWFIFILAYPLASTASLKTDLGGDITFLIAFANLFFIIFLFFLVDLVLLDWLIISKITPKFVVIEGTSPDDYKDFSQHYKGHLIASTPLILICLIASAIFVYF